MAFTTVISHATGDVFPAADWNTYIRDNLSYLHGDAGTAVDLSAGGQVVKVQQLQAVGSAQTVGTTFGAGQAAGFYVDSGGRFQSNAAANLAFLTAAIVGDAQFRVTMTTNGVLSIGPGGSTAPDTTLARSAAGALIVSNVLREVKTTMTYGATVTPNAAAGKWQTVTITNATAFTVALPTNPPGSTETQDLALEFNNTSGGTTGAITFNAGYLPLVASVPVNFTTPMTTGKKQTVFLRWNGVNWICLNATGLY